MTTPGSAPIDVQGGAYGITADCEALLSAASALRSSGTVLLERAVKGQQLLTDPSLVAPGVFDPGGALRFEAALVAALDGPRGLLGQAARLETLALTLGTAATLYEAADRFNTTTSGFFDPSGDADAHESAAFSLAIKIVQDVPPLGGLLAVFATVELLTDGHAVVRSTGPDPTPDRNGPPRSVSAVLAGLDARSGGGNIDIRILTTLSPSGEMIRHVIVDIPGTDDWSPSQGNPDVTNLGTNVLAIEGHSTTYEDGVIQAMRQAGVRPTDDVMLVGHSQGGMVAVTTARDVSISGEFHVSHVITAGAPIGQTVGQLPRSVSVLAIENSTDVVPTLDGVGNPDLTNVLTVRVHHPHSSVGASHSVAESYIPGAQDIDANVGGNRSVAAYLNSLAGFFGADSVATETFHISRKS